MHYAVSIRQLAMVELLISEGSNLNQGNDNGDTPFDYMEGDELFLGVVAQKAQS